MTLNNRTEEKLTTDEKMLMQMQKDLSNQHIGASDRTYYKDLNFKSIKDYYNRVVDYSNALSRLLDIIPSNKKEFEELVKMKYYAFKKIEELVDGLTFDWVEATASFSGSSAKRQEAYEDIIDEIKSAISSCNPTDDDDLNDFMRVFKHIVKWLLSESLNYSLGERVDSTDPQRYGLEHTKVQVSAGIDAMNKGQLGQQQSLNKGRNIPFRKKGSSSPPTGDREG